MTTPTLAQSVNITSLPLAGADVDTVQSVRDLGVIFDSSLNFKQHVNAIIKNAYFHLYRIGRVRKYLSKDATKTLVHALVLSRMDYCNVVLNGLPDCVLKKLQLVQNHAARLIAGIRKYDHVSPELQSLHWLPIRERIIYKVLLITFKVLHGLAPSYLCDLVNLYVPTRSLRSSSQHLLQEPPFRLKCYGARSFQCAAPRLWNNLPYDLRTQSSLIGFKKSLKTHIFKNAYMLWQ